MSLQAQLEQRLAEHLTPALLQVENESHQHSGPATESHFKVVIVSDQFDGLPLIKRHRAVHEALGDLMAQFHALALHTYTPLEWAQRTGAPPSPPCRGGSKRA
ncbi:transcriptional regulator, BolA protein family [Sulfurivirga caldicuralii]|uniref:Transcriptional regulator, BolA protein family n=1 Tax=Sulfurivirga caldicuralii TaxID=364032 RepID=A0A1N6G1Z6_9GAMM|nr:BolA family protein [Sulfurivirga caldicuralii]SIO01579.1 transcriptional regulator, BolA protein family [Sulfurivirga caldicuralii]